MLIPSIDATLPFFSVFFGAAFFAAAFFGYMRNIIEFSSSFTQKQV
jgi:hypothetical protein